MVKVQQQTWLCVLCAEASACDVKGEGEDAGAASTSSVYVDIVGGETSPDTDMPDQLPGATAHRRSCFVQLYTLYMLRLFVSLSKAALLLFCDWTIYTTCSVVHCRCILAFCAPGACAFFLISPSSVYHLHALSFAAAADWDHTLSELWQTLRQKTAKLTCKEVQDNSEVPTAPSCTITVCHRLLLSVMPTLSAALVWATYKHVMLDAFLGSICGYTCAMFNHSTSKVTSTAYSRGLCGPQTCVHATAAGVLPVCIQLLCDVAGGIMAEWALSRTQPC